ncbi:MAG: NAD(P)/FAD-dependent oxidoreductase [bacterium]|nr:NAD(P)/FAD-dependent oxidoreductase [bacterium]
MDEMKNETGTGPARDDYDVVVIGAGPAGTTAATLIAREGRSVLMLERDRFPRYVVGESLMPATYWTLQRLGLWERVKQDGFVKKHSVQFFSKGGRSSTPFYFHEFDGHESSQTWQVDRERFDQLLVEHAVSSGVEMRDHANVKQVLFEDGRAGGVEVELADGTRRRLTCRVVVDTSGQTALISRKLGLRRIDPLLQHASFFTRFRGAWRGEGIDEGATLILASEVDNCWFWYIPLAADEVSVGVVGHMDHLLKGRVKDPQQVFAEEVERCPAVAERIAAAEQTMEMRVMRDFSYVSQRIAGDGWVMAGDAFGFLDPMYSTGVFLAFKSAELAADSVLAALESGDLSGESLGRHGADYLAGMESMRKLVYAFYDPGFSFPKFLKMHPDCREPLVNLLVGNVYHKSIEGLFESMAKMCELPEARTLDGQGQPS